MKVFAERLKELRSDAGLSLAELSKAIKVSTNTISRWEREERLPNIEGLISLAKYFKVSTDYLCGLED